jgi:hypothetical protein
MGKLNYTVLRGPMYRQFIRMREETEVLTEVYIMQSQK